MGILAALIIALLVSMMISPYRKGGSIFALLVIFFILFLAGLAGEYWIVPFGPMPYGVSVFPLLFIVIIVTFLLATPSPYQRRRANDEIATTASAAISIFFWLLLILFLIAVVAGFLRTTPYGLNN